MCEGGNKGISVVEREGYPVWRGDIGMSCFGGGRT